MRKYTNSALRRSLSFARYFGWWSAVVNGFFLLYLHI